MKMLKGMIEKKSKSFFVLFNGKQALFCPYEMEIFVILVTNTQFYLEDTSAKKIFPLFYLILL